MQCKGVAVVLQFYTKVIGKPFKTPLVYMNCEVLSLNITCANVFRIKVTINLFCLYSDILCR